VEFTMTVIVGQIGKVTDDPRVTTTAMVAPTKKIHVLARTLVNMSTGERASVAPTEVSKRNWLTSVGVKRRSRIR